MYRLTLVQKDACKICCEVILISCFSFYNTGGFRMILISVLFSLNTIMNIDDIGKKIITNLVLCFSYHKF